MSTRRSIILSLPALAVSGVIAPAAARSGTDPAVAARFVDGLADETVALLRADLPGPTREAGLRELLNRAFDLAFLARVALGRTWKEMNADERAAFQAAFEVWVLRTYAARLAGYAGQRFVVLGADRAGEDAQVRSEVTGSGAPFRIDWRVRSGAAGPKIVDVVVEGVSMVVTHRNELQALVQRQGVAGLIRTLRSRAEAGAA